MPAETWCRPVRRIALVLACLWPVGAVLLLTRETGGIALALLAIGSSGVAARSALPAHPESAGSAEVFVGALALAWSAIFTALWLATPWFVRHPTVVFAPGAAVARAFGLIWLAQVGVALFLGVLGALAWSLLWRVVRRCSARLRAAVSALALAGALVFGVATAAPFEAPRGLPLDRYAEELPVVQLAAGSRCFELEGLEQPVLAERNCEYSREWCSVGDSRQPSDAPCEALLVQRDVASSAVLIRARTQAGFEPVLWCRTDRGLECPDAVSALDLRMAVSLPEAWRTTAMLGVVLALTCVVTSLRTVRKLPGWCSDASLVLLRRAFVVALICVLGTAIPSFVSRGLGFSY